MTGFERRKRAEAQQPARAPGRLWSKWKSAARSSITGIERNLWTCGKCGFHFRISARSYVKILLDEGSFQERFSESSRPIRSDSATPAATSTASRRRASRRG